ncbi:MAG: MFS transporter [Hyphomicrobiales bacterium]
MRGGVYDLRRRCYESWAIAAGLLTVTACWLAAGGVFAAMASVTLVPRLVADDRAKTAFSQKTAIFSLKAVIGPMLGGFVISMFGGRFFLGFVGVGLSLISLIFIREKFAFSPTNPRTDEKSVNGFNLVFKIKTELCGSIISVVFNRVFNPFLILILPVLIMGHYKMTAFQVGLLQATFAAGVLLGGGFVVERVNALIGMRNAIALGGALIAVAILAYALTPTPFFALYGLYQFVAGMGLALFNVNVTTIRCLATPSPYRTKMESAFLLICMSSIPAGLWLFGHVLVRGSLFMALSLCGVILFLAALAVPHLSKLAVMGQDELDGAYRRFYPDAFAGL